MIVELEDAKYKLTCMRTTVKELGHAISIDELRRTAEELDAKTLDPDFWGDQENSSKVLQTIKRTKDKIEEYDALCAKLEDAIALAEIAIEENEESYIPDVLAELAEITAEEESSVLRSFSRASMTQTMPSSPSTPVRAEQRLRTGHSCFTE